jgi:hypothetical protein
LSDCTVTLKVIEQQFDIGEEWQQIT